jgi:hypothetical protein
VLQALLLPLLLLLYQGRWEPQPCCWCMGLTMRSCMFLVTMPRWMGGGGASAVGWATTCGFVLFWGGAAGNARGEGER